MPQVRAVVRYTDAEPRNGSDCRLRQIKYHFRDDTNTSGDVKIVLDRGLKRSVIEVRSKHWIFQEDFIDIKKYFLGVEM
jgi:hypothetical protein